jgi:hypothetical protein
MNVFKTIVPIALAVILSGCWTTPKTPENNLEDNGTTIVTKSLTITRNGAGTGTVTSSPDGINCGDTCSTPFEKNSNVLIQASLVGAERVAERVHALST